MISLSVVVPAQRDDLGVLARILRACSWAGPRIETIVRDASGCAARAKLLQGIARENCRVIIAPPGDARANRREALRAARGAFVCVLGEDDVCFDRAIAMLPGIIEGVLTDPAIVGIAAPALIETPRGAQAFAYPNVDAGDPLVRLSGFLSASGPNLLASAPIRRTSLERACAAIDAKPLAFPFDDRLVSLLCLLYGKFARSTRLMHIDARDGSDAAPDAGRAPPPGLATARLARHLCGFEGAALIRSPTLVPGYTDAQRQALAGLWLSSMLAGVDDARRAGAASAQEAEAEALCARWREAGGRLSCPDMLADVCRVLALSSQQNADAYQAYWGEMLGLRRAPAA